MFTHSDRLIVMRDSCVISEHLTREVDVDSVITEMIGRELRIITRSSMCRLVRYCLKQGIYRFPTLITVPKILWRG